MKRIIILIIDLVIIFHKLAVALKQILQLHQTDDTPSTVILFNTNPSDTPPMEDNEFMNKTIVVKINNIEVDVYWLDNDSVKELKKLAKNGLTINMYMYSDFEQVGSIDSTLPSSGTRITTTPGNICLYLSYQLVVFYGSKIYVWMKN